MMVNKFVISKCVQNGVDDGVKQWYQEVRNVFIVGKCNFILVGKFGEYFGVKVMCWIYCKFG